MLEEGPVKFGMKPANEKLETILKLHYLNQERFTMTDM